MKVLIPPRPSFTLYLALIVLMFIGGCSETDSHLKTFLPDDGSPYKISFSYPTEWEWEFPSQPAPNAYQLMLADIYPESRKAGILIDISVTVIASPNDAMSSDIIRFIKVKTTLPQFEILSDKSDLIDGHFARWFVTRTKSDPYSSRERPGIAEDIFILDKDRYYRIGLQYSEKETNQQFYTEFQAMIASIKFLP